MRKSEAKEVVKNANWIRSLASLMGRDRKASELEFVRTTEVGLIPRRLFKQVPDHVFDEAMVDRVYAYGGSVANDGNAFLYLMVDEKTREIHGVLWMNLNVFTGEMFVFLLSVDKEYRSSNLLTIAAYHLFRQSFDWKWVKPVVNFCTTRPHIWERFGCKRHKLTQMYMTKEWFEAAESEMNGVSVKI